MGTEIKKPNKTNLPHHPCHPAFSQETGRCSSSQERVKQLCKAHLASPVCTWSTERTPALSSAVLGEEPQLWLSTAVFVAFFVNKSKGDFGLCVRHGLYRAGQGKLLLTESIVEVALPHTISARLGPERGECWACWLQSQFLLCFPTFSHKTALLHKRKTETEKRGHQIRALLGFLLDHQDLSRSHPANTEFAIMTFSGNYSCAFLLKCFIPQRFCSSMKHSWLDFQHCYTWGLLYGTVSIQKMWVSPFSNFHCTFWRKIEREKLYLYIKIFFKCLETL